MKRTIAVLFLLSIFPLFAFAQELKTREQLQADLAALETQIAEQQKAVESKQKEGVSLSRDINVLDGKIKQSQIQIKAHEKVIGILAQNISDKDKNISLLNYKVDREKESLSQILRKSSYLDNYSMLDFMLQDKSLSSFFIDVDSFSSVQRALNKSFEDIRVTTTGLEKVKSELLDNKQEEEAVKQAKLLEKKKIELNQKDKKTLLVVTKGQEAQYKKILADKQAQAAQIRSALFELTGAKSINFGQAYDIALRAQAKTGIRPAFLLGLITLESNLGGNVGKGTYQVDMHPTRDVPIFKKICEKLGLNPDNMAVSKKQWYGYGGAMGPAQFIPSTWVMYENRVAKLTGHNPPSPWSPEDSFMAAALYLTDNGAANKTRASETRAAMCYLAGCGNANKPSLQFYAKGVLSYADKYEAQIKILQN